MKSFGWRVDNGWWWIIWEELFWFYDNFNDTLYGDFADESFFLAKPCFFSALEARGDYFFGIE